MKGTNIHNHSEALILVNCNVHTNVFERHQNRGTPHPIGNREDDE